MVPTLSFWRDFDVVGERGVVLVPGQTYNVDFEMSIEFYTVKETFTITLPDLMSASAVRNAISGVAASLLVAISLF